MGQLRGRIGPNEFRVPDNRDTALWWIYSPVGGSRAANPNTRGVAALGVS